MKKETRRLYQDNGHAWLRVRRSELESMQLLDEISRFSYEHLTWVYLEEDQDMGIYIKAMEDRGYCIEFDTKYSETSNIRRYRPFTMTSYEKRRARDRIEIDRILREMDRFDRINREDFPVIRRALMESI